MDIMEYVAKRIRALREGYAGRGISQEALANKVGTTANTISRWETNTYKPSIEDLERLSRFFGESILTFFPTDEERTVDDEVGALLRAAKELKPDDILELRRYAEFRKARSLYEGRRPTRHVRRSKKRS